MRNLPIHTQGRSMLGYTQVEADDGWLPATPHLVHNRDGVKSYLAVLSRRKWFIIVPMLLIIPIMVLSFYLTEVTYQTSARVLVEHNNAKILDIQDVLSQDRGLNFLLTEYQIMQSEAHLAEVVDTLDLDQKIGADQSGLAAQFNHAKQLVRSGIQAVKDRVVSLFGIVAEPAVSSGLDSSEILRQAAIVGLHQSMQIRPQPGGKLVDFVVSGPNPVDVALQANTLVDVYARRNLEKKQAAATSATTWLNEQTTDLRRKMYQAELKLQQVREKEGRDTFDEAEKNSLVFADLQRLYNEYNAAKTARLDSQNRLNNLLAITRGGTRTLQPIPPYLDSGLSQSIRQLHTQYQELAIKKTDNSKLYREKHPVMTRLNGQMEEVGRAIDEAFQKAVAALQAAYNVHLTKEQALETAYQAQRRASRNFKSDSISFDALRRDADSYRNLYKEASERLREIKLDQASAINNVSIIKRALVPTQPIPSKAGMQLLSAIFLAGCVGVGGAFIREYFDNRFTGADEVEPFLQLPFLGVVPHYNQDKGQAYEPVSFRDPASVGSEAYRILRARIQAAAPQMQTLLVTSALPSEGKSTTTANLGIALARLGLNVLLVDLDLRRPSLHRHFWMANFEGVATALVGEKPWRELLQDTPIRTLKVLPTGFSTHNPSDLLSLGSTTELLEQFKHEFDLIIFDGPIVLSIPDVEIIAPWMDRVVLVHCPERCDKSSVLTAKLLLERAAANLLGVVLNNIRRQDQKYYYQQQTYYAQNPYVDADQYDIGLQEIRHIQTVDTPAAPEGAILAGTQVSDEVEEMYRESTPIAIQLGRVIVNDTILGQYAGNQLTFLILELVLSHTSTINLNVVFHPESATIHLEDVVDPDKKVVHCDGIATTLENGLAEAITLTSQETQRGMLVYRIPRGVLKCVLEYEDQHLDITIGF